MLEVSEMFPMHAPRVVVGVDDSLSGLAALRFAAAEARRRGAELRAIRVCDTGMSCTDYDIGGYRAAMVDASVMVIYTAFQEAMGGLPSDVVVEALAIEGRPAEVLVAQAGGVDDLLVVGRPAAARGWRRRLRRFWRRVTTARVDIQCVRTATCPIVIVGAPALAAHGTDGSARDVVRGAERLLRDTAAGWSAGHPAQPA
jgi:nucleotide-binding universal stress UspA family protein